MLKSSEICNIRQKLEMEKQEHILYWWDHLLEIEKEKLLQQIDSIDFKLLNRLIEKNGVKVKKIESIIEPPDILTILEMEKNKEDFSRAKEEGEKLLREGKVCFVLVAGGDATRLGYDGPKGHYKISSVKKKRLFHLHAEKILALGKRYNFKPSWYIMTSETNNDATRKYFVKNNFFGLGKENVVFFIQEMLPAIDLNGRLILKDKYTVFRNPSGHGGCMRAMAASGVLDIMRNRGEEEIFYFQVDNVLVKIGDPVFLGYHKLYNSEMSSKIIQKKYFGEKMGIIAKINGKTGVIEYTELPENIGKEKNDNGTFKYGAGNIAIHFIKREFVEKWNENISNLPFHGSYKKIPYMNHYGEIVHPAEVNAIKFESFIFDCLPYTERTLVMEVKREEEFSPIKNASGEDSPETAVRDMDNFYGNWLIAAGLNVAKDKNGNISSHIEISPLYALDKEEFLNKFFNKAEIKKFYLK